MFKAQYRLYLHFAHLWLYKITLSKFPRCKSFSLSLRYRVSQYIWKLSDDRLWRWISSRKAVCCRTKQSLHKIRLGMLIPNKGVTQFSFSLGHPLFTIHWDTLYLPKFRLFITIFHHRISRVESTQRFSLLINSLFNF